MGRRRAESSAGACKRELGAARCVLLASPLVLEEGIRRLGAPPSRGFGWRLQRATWGRFAISRRFAASSTRRAPSVWGAAEPRARLVLASATWGRLAILLSLRRWFKKKGAVGLGRRRAEGSAGTCERDLGAARHVALASPLVKEEGRRRFGEPQSRGLGWYLRARLGGGSPCCSRFAAG